jgi:hypothetical protein
MEYTRLKTYLLLISWNESFLHCSHVWLHFAVVRFNFCRKSDVFNVKMSLNESIAKSNGSSNNPGLTWCPVSMRQTCNELSVFVFDRMKYVFLFLNRNESLSLTGTRSAAAESLLIQLPLASCSESCRPLKVGQSQSSTLFMV